MFDIGFSELLVIALVALVVLGPERLPKAARMAGMWMRRARMQWQAVKSELENELADEDMRRSILRAREELREAQESLRADGARLRAQMADVEARMTEPSAAIAAEAPVPPGDVARAAGLAPEHAHAETRDTPRPVGADAEHASARRSDMPGHAPIADDIDRAHEPRPDDARR
jgi:sec-independent protein translocase protein TatB